MLTAAGSVWIANCCTPGCAGVVPSEANAHICTLPTVLFVVVNAEGATTTPSLSRLHKISLPEPSTAS